MRPARRCSIPGCTAPATRHVVLMLATGGTMRASREVCASPACEAEARDSLRVVVAVEAIR